MDSLVMPCPACTALNRLPGERLVDRPVCSSCRHPLLGEPVQLTEASFARVVAKTTLPIVVDFWAAWCGPCRQMAPAFAAAAADLAGRFVFAKVDTEAAPRLAAQFGIQSIPTLVLLQGGNEVRRTSGAMPKQALVGWLTGGR